MIADPRRWFLRVLAVAFFGLVYLLAPVITPFVSAAALAYLGVFVRGQLTVMFALGVIYPAGLWLLGLARGFDVERTGPATW